MTTAIDYSFASPNPAEIVSAGISGVLVYTGPARPSATTIADLRAHGLTVCLIQESDPNRSQQGYQAGSTDAHYADGRADEVGYPTECAIAYVVSDGSAGDPNYGQANISEYARGVKETSRRPFFWYGNEYACNAALVGGGGLGTWIPSTWGNGSLLTQESNLASPIADTDVNTVHAPYGAWGGATPTLEDDIPMYDYFATSPWDPTQLQVWWFSCAGHRYVPPSEWAAIKVKAVFDGRPEPKPFKGTAEMFNASRDTNAVSSGGAVPLKVVLSGTASP